MSHGGGKDEPSFFERERERLTRDIKADFVDVLSSTNDVNRKLEEVLGMTREYATIAALWDSFYQLMKESGLHAEEEAQEAVSPASPMH